MSQLSDFYTGKGTDNKGRTHAEMCSWDWEQLESVHDYIQWLFPLKEMSRFNPDAPLLTDDDIDLIDPHNVLRSLEKMYDFYGIQYLCGKVYIDPKIWDERRHAWVTPGNHNFLRITRILKSLLLFELPNRADTFFVFLEELYELYPDTITPKTMNFWREAVQ